MLEAFEILEKSKKILFVTGAGISSASGIPTFRDTNGIWQKYNPLLWATKQGLYLNYIFNYKKFKQFLIDVLEPIAQATPNIGHVSIAKCNKEVCILTQNIDNLHQLAGSDNVLEIHGNIFEIHHGQKLKFKLTNKELISIIHNIKISKNKIAFKKAIQIILNFKKRIRPNVILFGEEINLHALNEANNFLNVCDCLIIVGTSLKVYPAANIISLANGKNIKIINIGFEKINKAINIRGTANDILSQLLK